MVIYIDIDNTICKTQGVNYIDAIPIEENIIKANRLYDEGNTIIYWTARGTVSNINYENLTKSQFKKWNVKYHKLVFGKPYYDLFIDDKNINTKDWI